MSRLVDRYYEIRAQLYPAARGEKQTPQQSARAHLFSPNPEVLAVVAALLTVAEVIERSTE